MDNRHTKRRSASLLIRATHVEPTVRRRLTPVRLASITKTAAAGEDVGRRGPHPLRPGARAGAAAVGNGVAGP